MLRSLFLKSLYDMRRGLIWWSVGLFLMNYWLVSIFPSIEESAGALTEYMENLPPSFQALVGDATNIATVEGYLGVELFSIFLPMLTLAFAISYGGGAIGGEEDQNTLDLLLSFPIPRWRVLVEKLAALVVFALLALTISHLGIVLGMASVDASMDMGHLAAASLNTLLLTLVFGALTLALTGLGLRRGAAAGISAGLAAITFLMNTLAPISDLPKAVQQVSPWYYYNGSGVLLSGLEIGNSLLLLGLIVLFVIVALFGFQRRDIAV
jgi:ABC-2 type transport system permease protein